MHDLEIEVPGDVIEFDEVVCDAIEAAWAEGEARALVGNLLSGLEHRVTGLRGHLRGSWKLWRQWGQRELPDRALPISVEAAMVLGLRLWKKGFPGCALLVVIAFDAFLRTTEFMGMTAGQLTFNNGHSRVHISLPLTKSSKRKGGPEGVTVAISPYVKALHLLVSRKAAGERIAEVAPREFRSLFESVRKAVHLPDSVKPYSLRRGGATEFFRQCGSMAKTMERGRWSETRTAKVYINTAMADLASITYQNSRALHNGARQFHETIIEFCAKAG